MSAIIATTSGTSRSSQRPGRRHPLCGWVPLRYDADWRSLGFLALLLLLFLLQWTGGNRAWFLLPPTCLLCFIAFVIKHNHIHCRTFASRRWNRALDFVLSLATGQSTTSIVPIHNERHHARSQSGEDCVRSSVVNFRWNWLNLLVFPFAAAWRVRWTKPVDHARWRAEQPRRLARCQHERRIVLVFLAGALACDWRATLLYFGVPWLFGQWGIVTINLLQHQDCDAASAFDHSRNLTGPLVNWLCLNNGFHTAHHLRPALHWSRLREFHAAHVAPRMQPELNETSLARCVWRRFLIGQRSGGTP